MVDRYGQKFHMNHNCYDVRKGGEVAFYFIYVGTNPRNISSFFAVLKSACSDTVQCVSKFRMLEDFTALHSTKNFLIQFQKSN